MNIYLLQVLSKWLSIFVVSLMSLFGLVNTNEYQTQASNNNFTKNINFVSKVIDYDTIKKYNSKKPIGNEKVLVKGVDGIIYVDTDSNDEVLVKKVKNEVVEIGTGPSGSFVGKVTGYGPDCYGCSKTGTVSCHTKNGGKHSLIKDGVYYKDSEYGKVRILAASRTAFPCGTVISLVKGKTKVTGVVLDSGASMNNAWANGEVWIDLAYKSQSDARKNGIMSGKNINVNVERWGW